MNTPSFGHPSIRGEEHPHPFPPPSEGEGEGEGEKKSNPRT